MLHDILKFCDLLPQESDKKILEAEELTKPEKPKMMDINEAKQKIIDRMEEIRRKPGIFTSHHDVCPLFCVTVTIFCINININYI